MNTHYDDYEDVQEFAKTDGCANGCFALLIGLIAGVVISIIIFTYII